MAFDQLGYPILRISVRYEPDVVTARQKTRRMAALLGFENQDQARLATAVSELARNLFQYAGGGTIEFSFKEDLPQTFYVRVSDTGPGIPQLSTILNGTYDSPHGMGVGLCGTKKLMDFFNVETEPAKGTCIVIGKMLHTRAKPVSRADLADLTVQISGRAPENVFEEIRTQNQDLLTALEELETQRQSLSELNRELDETNRGVVALYAELDEKAASLQRANEVKTSFLSNMTHEFRTPLSSIISLTRLLIARVDGPLTEEQEKQVNYIRQSAEGLLELVNDLLDLAKVEAGKVSIQVTEFQIEELLGGLRGMFRPILGMESAVDFEVDWDPRLTKMTTDQGKLNQILRNLVSNAIKFTERGVIKVTALPSDRARVHFVVEDTGIGIAADFLDVIFQDFSQANSKLHARQKGTGLGLPLSRKLARLLGGDLWVESDLGTGSRFHVVIPSTYTGAGEVTLINSSLDSDPMLSSSDTETAHPKFSILLVDDDEPSRYVLKGLVAAEIDADFTETATGDEALDAIANQTPDLVFLDLNMRPLDGFEVLDRIRQKFDLQDLPVIVNTAKKLSPEEMIFLSKQTSAILSKERTDEQAAVRDLRRALVKSGFDYKSM